MLTSRVFLSVFALHSNISSMTFDVGASIRSANIIHILPLTSSSQYSPPLLNRPALCAWCFDETGQSATRPANCPKLKAGTPTWYVL